MDEELRKHIVETLEDADRQIYLAMMLLEGYLAGQICHLKKERQTQGVNIPNKALSWLEAVRHDLKVLIGNKLRD